MEDRKKLREFIVNKGIKSAGALASLAYSFSHSQAESISWDSGYTLL